MAKSKALMQYRGLSFSCECGQAPLRITQVGLTADHQLLICWWCARCKKMVNATKPLADCWKDCPTKNLILVPRMLGSYSLWG
jgi:hypothetical protein